MTLLEAIQNCGENKGCHHCRYYLSNSCECLQETMQRGHLMRDGLIGRCALFVEIVTPEQVLSERGDK